MAVTEAGSCQVVKQAVEACCLENLRQLIGIIDCRTGWWASGILVKSYWIQWSGRYVVTGSKNTLNTQNSLSLSIMFLPLYHNASRLCIQLNYLYCWYHQTFPLRGQQPALGEIHGYDNTLNFKVDICQSLRMPVHFRVWLEKSNLWYTRGLCSGTEGRSFPI